MRLADLGQVGPGEDAVFGGKARGLARLMAASALVPPGFAVEATTLPPDRWPESVRYELLARAAALLRGGALAVRSSAVAEDARGRSFAGLFETALELTHLDTVLSAVAGCVASGGAARVLAYAGAAAPLPVGVVVQRHVGARAAGVCFTRDPQGVDGAIVLEAVRGAGVRLVSGQAQPEGWRVYRDGRGRWDARCTRSNEASVLSPAEAGRLAAEAAELAHRLGEPLDLEWALDAEGRLFWLQARPITAAATPLPPLVVERFHDGVDDGPITVWSNWNLRETMPRVFPRLAWTLWRDVVLPSAAEPLFGVRRGSRLFRHLVSIDLVQGRPYWNMNTMLASPMGRRMLLHGLEAIDARAAAVTRRLIEDGILRPRRLPGAGPEWTAQLARVVLGLAAGLGAGLRPRRTMAAMERCAAALSARPPLETLDDERLVAEMALLDTPACAPFRDGQQAMVVSFALWALAERAFRRHPEARSLLSAGISGNPTTAISVGVDELVALAQPLAEVFAGSGSLADLRERLGASAEGREWLGRFEAFLARYGHRGPGEFDFTVPRWSEDPGLIVDLVRSALETPAEPVSARLARLAEARRRAVRDAARSAPLWRRPVLRLLARLLERHMPMREAPKHYALVAFQRMRGAVLELGRRLAARGLLDEPQDVFHLEWPELRRLAAGDRLTAEPRQLVRERRRSFERLTAQRPADFVRSDGVPVEDVPHAAPEGALSGIGVSAGRASGPARLLRTPAGRDLRPGDVLVVQFADPGWTPLFPRTAAVVMEVGGAMCHAAVVARELGVPAVFAVAGAMARLRDGETVEVDGDRGLVWGAAGPG